MFERDGSYWLLQISFGMRKVLTLKVGGFFWLTLKLEKNLPAKLEENFKSYGL